MSKYKHIFFDLDRTLWDFQSNTELTIQQIVEKFDLINRIDSLKDFTTRYHVYNEQVWDLHKTGEIRKHEVRLRRFRLLLADYNMEDEKMVERISRFYLQRSPDKAGLMPNALQLLNYLKEKKYNLYIISNGFLDTQNRKLMASGISDYFDRVITSDYVKSAKPKKEIFEYAVKSANAKKKECLMIGDDVTNDIKGAIDFGMDQVFYNSLQINVDVQPTYMVKDLIEIKAIL